MTDDEERIIDEVASSVDPVLRWYVAWASEGFPVDVDGKHCFLSRNPVLMANAARQGLVVVQTVRDIELLTQLPKEEPQVQVMTVKLDSVKVPAPEHVREWAIKILG